MQKTFRALQEEIFINSNQSYLDNLHQQLKQQCNLQHLTPITIINTPSLRLKQTLVNSVIPMNKLQIYSLQEIHIDELCLVEHMKNHLNQYYLITLYTPDWLPPNELVIDEYFVSIVTEVQYQKSKSRRMSVLQRLFNDALKKANDLKHKLDQYTTNPLAVKASTRIQQT
jgi:hypothetical protein